MEKVIPTESEVRELLSDWFERDGETFLKIRKTDRIGWEHTIDSHSYSAYLLEPPTQEDLIKRAYQLAKDMIISMDIPDKVTIRITPDDTSSTNGKLVKVSTRMFDDKELSVGEKLDAFLGTTIHEGCHLLYTDFTVPPPRIPAVKAIANIIEDERIEEKLGEDKPGFANFLEKSKYYYYDMVALDFFDKLETLNPFERIMNCLLQIIRYPKYLKYEDVVEFYPYLVDIKKLLLPFPKTFKEVNEVAAKIFEIIKRFYADLEKSKPIEPTEFESDDGPSESSDGSSDEGGDEGGDERTEEKGISEKTESTESDEDAADKDESEEREKDSECDSEKSDGVSETEKSESELRDEEPSAPKRSLEEDSKPLLDVLSKFDKDHSLSDEDAADVVADTPLGEICEGVVELGKSKDTFFSKASENSSAYNESYRHIRKYIPAMSKAVRCKVKEYKLVHKSMRSGVLDTSKLAEAVQGVPTVYIREGEVLTDGVSVCVLIDESGSMCGSRIDSARDAAVLLNEALRGIPNVELFIYGHTGDIRYDGATEITIYREGTFMPRYALGSVRARCENRDGVAIYEVANRVRKFTKNNVLMFVLSDGEPAAARYCGSLGIEHTRQSVLKAEKLGFHIVQVCIERSYDPAKMFKHFVVMDDMSKLAFQLGRTIKKATLSSLKVRET